MKKHLSILFLLPTLLFAQRNLPLNREWGLNIEKQSKIFEFIKDTTYELHNGHEGLMNRYVYIQESDPLKRIKYCIDCDRLTTGIYKEHELLSCFKPYIVPSSHNEKEESRSLLYRKLKQESLFIVNDTTDKFYLTFDPLFNFEAGRDFADKTGERLYKNTRGFLIRGDIGKNLSFETSFYENQATYVKYIDNYIASTNKLFPQTANYTYDVIPGQGRAKAFKKNGYDYAMASGYVSYSPCKTVNIQVGHGKHFVGDGYRSLLLSDNSFNYPYARITTTYKNIQYTNLYTSFMNLTEGGVKTPRYTERLFQKKTGNFQMLSVNFLHHIQLGLFQGMIWEAADSTNRQHVNFNTFDPLIGVNSVVYGLHNKNNVLLGATLKLKITNSFSLYGQCMLDDDIKKKYGYQVGFKYFDLFTIKNLHVQGEFNTIRPYAYAANNPEQSYTHYNQALAHPLGANFYEAIGFINYKVHDFFVEIKMNYAIKGVDSSSINFGGNIFKSDLGVSRMFDTQGQGLKTTIMYQDIHIGYLVNPATNFNIVLGVSNRIAKTYKTTSTTQFVYLGIRTSLANFYYDF